MAKPDANAPVLDETDKAYIAGFIDGEGTIGLRRRVRKLKNYREYWECNVSVCNTNEDIILWLQSKIGGYLTRYKSKNQKHKPHFVVRLRAKEARLVLPKILPYLKVKKLQADIVLAFLFDQTKHKSPGKKGHPEAVINFRKDLYGIASVMNTMGVVKDGTA